MWPFRRKTQPKIESPKNQFTYKVNLWPGRKNPYVAVIEETSRSLHGWDPISASSAQEFRRLDDAHRWAKAEIAAVKRLRAERDAFNAMGLGEPRD